MRISEIIARLMSLRKDTESHIGTDDDYSTTTSRCLTLPLPSFAKRNAASPVRKNITSIQKLYVLSVVIMNSARKRTSRTARNATVFLRRRKTNEIYALHR